MENYALIDLDTSIRDAVMAIQKASQSGGEKGIAVVLDRESKVKAVVTDGDIRKAISNSLNLDSLVMDIASSRFTYVYEDLTPSDQLKAVLNYAYGRFQLNDPRLSQVVVCDRDMRFRRIVNLFDLYNYGDISFRRIAVYGMGYVGLTLALTLAEISEVQVIGLDINKRVVDSLKNGKALFYERGLDSLLDSCLSQDQIRFQTPEEDYKADIHLICVGTPVDENGNIIYSYLEQAAEKIGEIMQPGNLVICRSTVPVGTTRKRLIPALEKVSGLKAGEDFHVAFAPERTVEGNALQELKSLPQVIGGYSNQCRDLAVKLFGKINGMIVQVDGLEDAELVKLINNTFRDTVFSFANDVALLCDEYNLNSFNVIRAANEGYPRNPIPRPSPGVGGICLVKDPFLYAHSKQRAENAELPFGKASRVVNRQMPSYPYRKLQEFEKRSGIETASKRAVFVIGLAFKGQPETSDMRFSPGVELAKLLMDKGYTVFGYDHVVPNEEIAELGITPVVKEEGILSSSATFVMNNHIENADFDVYRVLSDLKKPALFFDGWGQFNRIEIESVEGVLYSTLGYMTSEKNG